MSTIKTGTTLTTAYSVTGDTTGTLVVQTGSTPTTAATFDASQNTTLAGYLNAPNTFGFKNRLINGALGVWQRGTSFSSFPSGANTYTADRFASFVNGSGTIAVTQQAVTPTTFTALGAVQDPQYYLQYQCTSVGTISYFDLNQRIEDVRTFAGQNMTVSFFAKADTTRTVSLSLYQNFGSGGSADVAGSATNVTITSSWAKYTVTLACNSISGKTIGAGSWVGVVFGLPVAVMTFSLALVQAEQGSIATSFDYRPYGTELALCQRYYYQINPATELMGYAYATNSSVIFVPFPVSMRVPPTGVTANSVSNWTGYNATNGGSTVTAFSWNTAGVNSALIIVAFTVTSGTPSRIASGGSGTLGFTGAEL